MKIINEQEFEAVTKQGLVLVDFFATWCGPCKMLTPVLEELADKYAGQLDVVKVDVDESGNLAMRYGIMSVPTMLVFKHGEMVGTLQGFQPLSQLETALKQYM